MTASEGTKADTRSLLRFHFLWRYYQRTASTVHFGGRTLGRSACSIPICQWLPHHPFVLPCFNPTSHQAPEPAQWYTLASRPGAARTAANAESRHVLLLVSLVTTYSYPPWFFSLSSLRLVFFLVLSSSSPLPEGQSFLPLMRTLFRELNLTLTSRLFFFSSRLSIFNSAISERMNSQAT